MFAEVADETVLLTKQDLVVIPMRELTPRVPSLCCVMLDQDFGIMLKRAIATYSVRCVLLLVVAFKDLMRRFSRINAVRLFATANNILLLHSIIDTDMPKWRAPRLINTQATLKMFDRFFAIRRIFRQTNTLENSV